MGWSIGEVTITKVVEMQVPVPLAGLLPDATLDALSPHTAWLQPHFIDDEGGTQLSIHAFVIESDGLRILVDTCVGDREVPGIPGFRGDAAFPDRLAAAGFPVESIDVVVCTHMHFDHVGWNTRPEGDSWVPTFPNARYLFCRAEADHWLNREEVDHYASTMADAVAPILDAGLADLVEPAHVVTESVRFVPTPGHSPGHMSVLIESGGATALITGDATHHPVQWAEAGWGMAADFDPAQGTATRERLRAEHGDTDTLILGTHYAEPSAGHIVSVDGAWRFVAALPGS